MLLRNCYAIAAVSLALLLSAPATARAQRAAFVDAFVDFHSALFGIYGDEGPQVLAALDRMSAGLDAWEQSRRRAEAELTQRPGVAPIEWALLHVEGQQLAEAVAATKQAIAAEPTRAPLQVFLGRLHDALGQREDAAAAFAAARALDPSDPIAAYLAGFHLEAATPPLLATLMTAVDRAGAGALPPIPHFAVVDDLSAPTRIFAPPAYRDGFALVEQRRFREAIASFRASAARDPLVVDPAGRNERVVRGVAALRNRQGAAAIEQVQAAVRDLPSSSEAHRVLGVVYRANGRLAEGVAELEVAVRLAPGDERGRVALGSTLIEAGRLPEAESVLKETIAALPASGEARWALAQLYERLDRSLEATTLLEESATLIVVAGKAHLYWRIAEMAHGYRRDHARVIDVLRQRVRLIPNEAHAHKDLGLAYSRAGRDDEALLELLMARLMGHEDAEMLAVIGQIHLNQDRLERADAVLRRAVQLDPNFAQARYVFGRTLQRAGRAAEAAEQLKAFERLRAAAFEELRRKFERDGALPGVAVR